ncbi:MAG: hypothetical protein JW881_13310 [Spirochaetales bacterium]|nr:hypothetical protein [Spirochaetales bacterium]
METFDSYIAKKRNFLHNWPESAIEQLIYRHFRQAPEILKGKNPNDFHFTEIQLSSERIYKTISFNNGEWIDSIGSKIIKTHDNLKTGLMKYMLDNGTWPTEIIVKKIDDNSYSIFEGHKRLAYLKYLTKIDYSKLQKYHDLFVLYEN